MFKDLDFQFLLKMLFGYLVVSCLLIIGLVIIFKNVTAVNSYGIDGIIHTFELATSGFIGWMSGHAVAKATSAQNAAGSIPVPASGTVTASVSKDPAP